MTPISYVYDKNSEVPNDSAMMAMTTTKQKLPGSTIKDGDNGDEYVPSQGPKATQLVCGTELFSDTIYSKPITPPNTTYQHCLIDSSVRALRIKSNLMDDEPIESQFHDNGHGLAVTELVQLEEQENNANLFDLVYYQHPIDEATGGAKTEGLKRIPIKKSISGATKLFSSLAGSNNAAVMNNNGDLTFTTQCLLYVEINDGKSNGLLIYGKATSIFKGPNYHVVPDTLGSYVWSVDKMSSMNINAGYKSVRKFVNSGYKSGEFHEKNSYQHIVFNEGNGAHTLTMTPEGNISSTKLFYPNHANDAPVVHIDWNSNENRVERCVFYKASTHDDKHGNRFLITQSYEFKKVDSGPKPCNTKLPVKCTYTQLKDDNDHANNPPQSTAPINDSTGYGAYQYDWSKVNSVHDLYQYKDKNSNVYYVKLVEVSDQAYPAIIVLENAAEKHWWHRASYPLKTPDPDTGRGNITKVVSCFSKFGGMRYFFQDSNNNLYLSRQQRLSGNSTPYGKPIYGPYDVNGNVESSFESGPLSYSQNGSGFDWHDIAGNCYQTSSSTNIGSNEIPEQLVLSTLMAFDTNTSSGDTTYDGLAQAVCLSAGGVVDVATPRRTYHDSEYVSATISSDESGSTTTVGLYRSVNLLLERSWYHREITSQIDYNPEETQDSGDYYHLTLTPADDDGNIASLTTNDENKHLLVEIRSDTDCSVTDMVSNYYHSINRYASFMAEVDSATKQANIVLKATQLGQNIYARLVDSRALEAASESDVGLIGSSNGEKIFPWQLINITEQAQYRMGNTTPSDSSSQPGASGSNSFMDKTVYVTGHTVANSSSVVESDKTTGPSYETKGGFKQTQSGMQPTADFINQSGTNMLTVSSESSSCQTLYAQSTTSDKFDPLYCMHKTSSTQTTTSNTTSFTYASGEVVNEKGGFSAPCSVAKGELGSNVFKKVSHDVGDALHHLQHLSDSAYKKLNKGVQISINAAASDAICIDKSIMKAVNGIDNDLNEVIDTVEQYASICVEVLKTIIKNSFMYEFIEMIIWLVSLFRYLKDIQKLANSLESTFLEALKNLPTMKPADAKTEIEKYIGASGEKTIDSIFNSATNVSKQFGDKPPTNKLLNTVLNNPFTNKLIGFAANKASKAASAVLEFDCDKPSAGDSLFDDLNSDGAIADLTNLSMNSKSAQNLVGMVSQDVMDPQKIYQDFVGKISSIMGEIDNDSVKNIVDIAGRVGSPMYWDTDNNGSVPDDSNYKYDDDHKYKYNLYFVEQVIKSHSFVEIKLGLLGDLFKLCGLGSGSSSSLKVNGTDAIFFPMALALWVGLYITEGKSYNSVPSPQSEQAELGASFDMWGFMSEILSAVFGGFSGFLWGGCNVPGDDSDQGGGKLFPTPDEWCDMIVSVAQCTCFYGNNGKKPLSVGNAFDAVFVNGQIITTFAVMVNDRFSYTDQEVVKVLIKGVYYLISLADLIGDSALAAGGANEDACLKAIAQDVMTNVGSLTDMVYDVSGKNQADIYKLAWGIMFVVPTTAYTIGAVEIAV